MDELLNLARQLRPTALDDHGLVPAIEAQLRGFGERTGIDASLSTEGDPTALDEERQTVIYRVAQEALTNAGRHAGAAHVDVELVDARTAAPSCACATTARASTPWPTATAGSAWRAWPSGRGWWAASWTCARPPARAPS